MRTLLGFGDNLPEYQIPVLNEREARAAAGILFAISLIAFMNAWLNGNFGPIRAVSLIFFADFLIRVLISPRYSPSMTLGRFAVRNQKPEFVGAPQKHFAWALGLILATVMMVLVIGFDIRGPLNMLICVLCLTLLFFEAAFGICIGCILYRVVLRRETILCPGDVCEIRTKHPTQLIGGSSIATLVLLLPLLALVGSVVGQGSFHAPFANTSVDRCKVPAFAIAIGHEELWKRHNGCK